jgi:hypothetical protein
MKWTATDPSPTAFATRFTDSCRASPATNTPGTLAYRRNGGRASGHSRSASSGMSGPVRT